jgi:putative membrane protein
MGRRLYKFGHMMFGFAFLAGLLLWQGYRVFPQSFPNVAAGWAGCTPSSAWWRCCSAFFVWCGRCVKAAAAARRSVPRSAGACGTNCRSLLLFGIIYLVLAKPF